MNISNYTSFFHDGSVFDIQQAEDEIVISMSSAEVDEEDFQEAGLQDDIPLSKVSYDCIQGRLHICGIQSIKLNDNPYFDVLKKQADDGEILHFEIGRNFVTLNIVWSNYPFNIEERSFSFIEIQAEKIWWENIPNLEELYQ